jgi:hypothetical protein
MSAVGNCRPALVDVVNGVLSLVAFVCEIVAAVLSVGVDLHVAGAVSSLEVVRLPLVD